MGSEHRDYKGHRIELISREAGAARVREAESDLLIDGKPTRYDRLPNGKYFLRDYAFDWTDDLMGLAERWVDYQDKTDRIRRGNGDH
jgi:hypothetical protein